MKHTIIVTSLMVILFFAAQLIGLSVTQSYIDVEASMESGETVWKDLPSVAGVKVDRPDVEPETSIWYIMIAVVIGTMLILLIIKYGKMLLWKLWFFMAIVLCLQIALSAFITPLIAFILALLAGWYKVFKPNLYLHNLSELFVYGGLAAIFVPILNVFYAFVLLVVLSVYDMYAVWKSKHMVKMAKFQTESGIFAGLMLPYQLPKLTGKVKKKVRTAVLGGGDIGFPLIFAGTVMVDSGYMDAVIVAIGASLALCGLLWAGQKDKF